MPVRSGPTLPPSPECVWHLAHSFLKTSLPREASPPFRTIGASAWMTFSRSGSGRPPPLASRALARSAIVLSGWAARACDWRERQERHRHLARLDPAHQRVRPVRLAEQRQDARLPGRRGHRPHRVDQGRPHLGRVAGRRGGDQAAREVGRGLRRDEGDHVASGLRVGLAEVDELPGGVDAGGLGRLLVGGRREEVLRQPGDERVESLDAPARGEAQHLARATRSRASAGGRAMAFCASASSVGALSLRPALRAARRSTASRTRGLRSPCERQDRGDRVDRPAPRVVLGDPGGRRA